MVENRGLFLSEEKLNLISLSFVENISKYIPEIIEKVTPLVLEKTETHVKQL